MSRDNFRRRADAVRGHALEAVLLAWGAERDGRDRHQWRTVRGPVSVTGAKFFNFHEGRGGGGAIDLVMHLGDMDVSSAVAWLERHLGAAASAAPPSPPFPSPPFPSPPFPSSSSPSSSSATSCCWEREGRPLRLPAADGSKLSVVRRYLVERRGLWAELVDPLLRSGRVYGDARGNAVFVMVRGKANEPIGAELRGTGERVWHGLASGTNRDAGYFWAGDSSSERIVLCESAIDALSCIQWHWDRLGRRCLSISTAGVRSDAGWLPSLLRGPRAILCGFDADAAGEGASLRLLTRHGGIRRLRPPVHDWNAALIGPA